MPARVRGVRCRPRGARSKCKLAETVRSSHGTSCGDADRPYRYDQSSFHFVKTCIYIYRCHIYRTPHGRIYSPTSAPLPHFSSRMAGIKRRARPGGHTVGCAPGRGARGVRSHNGTLHVCRSRSDCPHAHRHARNGRAVWAAAPLPLHHTRAALGAAGQVAARYEGVRGGGVQAHHAFCRWRGRCVG